MEEFNAGLREHYYRAELIVYSSLLVVGVIQIVIRENFPNLQPPWPMIVIPLMIVLFGVVIVPLLVLVIRVMAIEVTNQHQERGRPDEK